MHRFFDGQNWTPSKMEDLAGDNLTAELTATTWGAGRLDVIGLSKDDGSLQHYYYDGSTWNGWESFGGNFSSSPVAVSWGNGRFDVFGIDLNGSILHKYWYVRQM